MANLFPAYRRAEQPVVSNYNDHKIIGTLEATKYHLEDMRTLMKLRKP